FENVTDRLALERSYNTLIAVQGETLDNLHEGIAVFGSDGRLKLANPNFAKLWGYVEDELNEGLHVADFVEKIHPLIASEGDWIAHKEHVVTRMTNREPSSGQLMRNDGLVLEYANVPLPDGAVLLSYFDVTDGVQVELALRERAEALQEADRLKSDFISDVSYEIRSPLTSIIGFAEVLSEETFGKLNSRQMEYIRGILEASQGLTSVISDIFDLATVEAGMMTLELDTVDLHGMMASVLGLMRERAKRKNMKLKLECPPDIGWIVGDEKRLKQVLFNLLSNAVSFSPQRTTVRLEGERKADEVILRVADTGPGLSETEQQLVFKAFEYTSSSDPAKAGPGLGLTLVRRFVELHGGYVRVKSAPGRGTTVSCHLPSGTQEMENAERGTNS
ncbi:MAG: ATP-binding protein, partial [Rhodospirillales bacterium]|nr:ATP-binding protein [Rhodospirillales bacterium]